ncbi:BatD family protein [Leptospira meyeri]|uniref:BatD family protein n=1 Tax=Leptospira meyeri TaxID=29508 RepID=UPI00223D5DEC|nr:BatD family protein [Leptospira meyeri]MCW7490551.1 BatD family protein [Leptospira meyeri]
MKSFGNKSRTLLFLFLFPLATIDSSEVEFLFSPNEFSLGEHAKLEVRAHGDKVFRAVQTNIKQNGVRIRFSGSGTETQIINFKVSKSQILNFYVDTESEGTFHLPEVLVEYDNKTFKSPPIQFKVSKKSRHSQNQFFNPFPFEDFEAPSEGSPEVAFHTNKTVFYKGEPIVGYFVLYYDGYRQPFLERDPNQSISFPYFLSETLRQVSVQIEPEVKRNNHLKKTLVYEKEIYGLTPVKSGKFQIGKTKFISGDSLRFNSLQETVDTTPATVTVLNLPSNQPESFTGAIGNFQLKLTNFPKEVRKAETVYFEITIEGEGGHEGIKPWQESKMKYQLVSQTRNKTFRKLESGEYGFYSIVRFLYGYQVREGEKLQLEPYQFSYFSLKNSQYKTLSLQFPTLPILAEKGKEPKQKSNQTTNSKAPSIFPLVFLAVLGTLSYLGYRKYRLNRQANEFVDMVQNFGKKRNIFLVDYLEKRGITPESIQLLSNLIERVDKETPKKTFLSLSKFDKTKVLKLTNQLKTKE